MNSRSKCISGDSRNYYAPNANKQEGLISLRLYVAGGSDCYQRSMISRFWIMLVFGRQDCLGTQTALFSLVSFKSIGTNTRYNHLVAISVSTPVGLPGDITQIDTQIS